MAKYNAVIFDMDGLLLDSERLALNAFRKTCRHFELGDLFDLFKQCIGVNQETNRSILKAGLEGLTDHEEFDRQWKERYAQQIKSKPVPLKEGAIDLLGTLQNQGLPMAVATSTSNSRALQKLGDTNILKYFDAVAAGDEVRFSKPNPEIFLLAARRLGVPAKRCLALEDSENGVRAAAAAGMRVIQIPDLVPPSKALLQLGHTVFNNLRDLNKEILGILA